MGRVRLVSAPSTPYLTEEEAAAYLRISPRSLANLRWNGKGGPRYRKHGPTPVYRLEDLDAWSEGRARLSSSQQIADDKQPESVAHQQ